MTSTNAADIQRRLGDLLDPPPAGGVVLTLAVHVSVHQLRDADFARRTTASSSRWTTSGRATLRCA